jgi:hypothetical protein
MTLMVEIFTQTSKDEGLGIRNPGQPVILRSCLSLSGHKISSARICIHQAQSQRHQKKSQACDSAI